MVFASPEVEPVIVIVVFPGASAVITPVLSTVATRGSSEEKVYGSISALFITTIVPVSCGSSSKLSSARFANTTVPNQCA